MDFLGVGLAWPEDIKQSLSNKIQLVLSELYNYTNPNDLSIYFVGVGLALPARFFSLRFHIIIRSQNCCVHYPFFTPQLHNPEFPSCLTPPVFSLIGKFTGISYG